MLDSLVHVLGHPVELEELKHKPGRRRTLRARGPRGTAFAKIYASDRAAVVARRVNALADGPDEPVVPNVLYVDTVLRLVVLSDVPGRPLREAILARDLNACTRAGVALAGWHRSWSGAKPHALEPHTAQREVEILEARLGGASRQVAEAIVAALSELPVEWLCTTVVHRDLYEDQILIGDRVGLIDVDDAALGPPELDLGNLVAHLELLERRLGTEVVAQAGAILDGYAIAGGILDPKLLDLCRSLSLLRLACINDDLELVRLAVVERVAV